MAYTPVRRFHWENRGHQLTMGEVEKAKEWYGKTVL